MPLYDFKCLAHGRINDIVARPDEHYKPCPDCGQAMTRLFPSSWSTIPDIQPYLDENMGHNPIYVKSRRHHKQLMKERGLVQLG